MEPKKSWQEIERTVAKSRLELYQYSSFTPTNFTFYKNLLIFLGVPPVGEVYTNENTLIYVDVENGCCIDAELTTDKEMDCSGASEEELLPSYHWNLLLDPQVSLNNIQGYSKEEELLRERKRTVSHGITSYEFDHEAGRLLFRAGADIYTADVASIASGQSKVAVPKVIPSNMSTSKMDAKICPSNANIISFIDNGDIWVANIVTGLEMRLTFVRSCARDDVLTAGVPAYVTQEEFDRFTGYWWEPRREQDMEGSLEVHKILYELVDQHMVEELLISSPPDTNFSSFVETYRYPKAGTSNAKSTLRLVEFCVKSSTNEFLDGSICEYELRVDLSELFPWMEYIVRLDWMPDGKFIWVQILNRAQNRTALLRIPCSAFRPITTNINMAPENFKQHKIDVMLEETSEHWINMTDAFKFLTPTRNERISFIRISEETKFKHLYQYCITTESGDGYIGDSNQFQSTEPNLSECVVRHCQLLDKKVLTSGDWEVDGEKILLDEKNELLYFLALKDTPLEKHLYCVSTTSPEIIHRLTPLGFSHSATLSQDCAYAVVVSSSISSFPYVTLYRILQNPTQNTGTMSLHSVGWIEPPRSLPASYVPPEIFSYTNWEGTEIHGMLFKPKNCVPGVKYPTMLYVYGGPGVQLVSNSQRSVRRLTLYALSTLGYAVVMLDTMGSCNRGIKFESVIKDSMGRVEIDQQIDGLFHIASKSGIIDLNKIVIHGWSYGGYLALMGLAQRPDVFKVAVAGAPVTCWELYDTAYTERYMSIPDQNNESYRGGSVLTYAKQFPSEPNRLLLVHGLVDENVHFSHTNALVSKLIKKGKPYQLQVYPNERHGIRSSIAAKHYETYVLYFIEQYLSSVT